MRKLIEQLELGVTTQYMKFDKGDMGIFIFEKY